MATGPSSATAARPCIQELPKDVVDRIAAGEVVQRPSSVIKELLENSLDANSSKICVSIEKGGLMKMVVSDNGCGIAREDLPLAATRFATSKLRSVDDLESIQSFGFRGEALASVSLVAKLNIVSRRRTSNSTAYRMEYRDGEGKKSIPIAGKEGTTVTVQDLFYNVPHRRKINEREEYQQILNVVQRYAIHYASMGVGMVCCRKVKGADTVDLNTTSLPSVQASMRRRQRPTDIEDSSDPTATRQVLSHLYGSKTDQHLLRLQCQRNGKDDTDPLEFRYQAHGFITNSSYEPVKAVSELILFVNERLVESLALKRSIEGVYAEFTKSKPLVYLSVTVPGHQVDVNVHPTKREVALLHQDELYDQIASTIRELHASSVQAFAKQLLLPKKESGKKRAANENAATTNAKRQTDPSRLVRTTKAAPAGALEPYLTSRKVDSPVDTPNPSTTRKEKDIQHKPDCEFYNKPSRQIDMSVPGAFAAAICRCQVENNVVIRTRRQVMVRPKRVVPTVCSYKSVQTLRSRVTKCSDKELARKLRDSTLVGILSRRQCLVQCGEELLLWNHFLMAQELFYQLALAGFGRGERAVLGGGGIDIKTVMEHALESEERLENMSDGAQMFPISETNSELAQQATDCLMDNSEMLEEYFSICFCRDEDNVVMLTGLPVLLEGHSPQPHGLPLFLLRLATEVDFTEERPCFEGVCKELGSYYAEIPMLLQSDDARDVDGTNGNELVDSFADQYVKHTLFPAVSFLLVPPKDFASDGTVSKLALLSSVYKVFERC